MNMIAVNLLPDAVRSRIARRRCLRAWGISLAVSLFALVLASVSAGIKRVEAGSLNEESLRLSGELSQVRAELRQVAAETTTARLQLDRANALRAKRAWSGVFAMLSELMPEGSWLTSLATDPPIPLLSAPRTEVNQTSGDGKPQRSITIDSPRKLRIGGYTRGSGDPHEFVARIKNTNVFQKVLLEKSEHEVVEGEPHFRFELVCEW